MTFPGGRSLSKHELDPWRVILSCLFEINSHEIPQIIDASGLAVDWRLTERDNYSHTYRKAAYRPRVNGAYEALGDDDRLRVAFIVSAELAKRGLADALDADLHRIGWCVNGGKLVPTNESIRELFFPQGSQHDAYVHIREIVRGAIRSVQIVDPYLDGTVFKILGDVQAPMTVQFLSAKLPTDFTLECERFRQQHPQVQIETRRSRDFHDRFIVLDAEKCWHLGCSIKDAGNKAFMVSAIEDARNADSLLKSLRGTWAGAAPHS